MSEIKGLFNHTVRQDQWDWYTTWTMLGCPHEDISREVAVELGQLRKVVLAGDSIGIEKHLAVLTKRDVDKYLSCFVEEWSSTEDGGGFLYILSTRESPGILKIGYTTRTPEIRVKEINSATGVIIPWAVRYAWRVREPARLEQVVHARLKDWRIRADREAFKIDFFKARSIIRSCLDEEK